MRLDKKKLYAGFYAFMVFIASIYLMPLYHSGDQAFYRDVYEYCFYENYTHIQQFFCYSNTIGSVEPIYFFTMQIAHNFSLNKDIFITLLNTLFTYLLVLVILKFYKITWHRHLFLFLVITNFYLLVLFFSAERLKISIIFLLLSLIFNSYKQLVIASVSLLTHIQTFFLVAPLIVNKILSAEISKLKRIIFFGGSIIVLGAIITVLQSHIISKFTAYTSNEDGGFGAIIKTGVYAIFALISTRKILPVLYITPVVLLSYFIGESRVGMIAFIIYAASVIYYKKRMDLILLVLLFYFSIKSISFIENIIRYGNGF